MKNKKPAISVVGLGKLGCPIAACFAAAGYDVIGVDLSHDVVESVNRGRTLGFEQGLQDLLEKTKGRLEATQDCKVAVAKTDVTLVVVPTPSDANGTFSNEYVLAACERIAKGLESKDSFHLVVIISTVMPGSTGDGILPTLEKLSGKTCGAEFGLCYAPTFVALGSVIRNYLNPDYVLIGESDPHSGGLLEGMYMDLCENTPSVARMNFMNAEITKLANNAFMTTKITFGNMLAQICERLPDAHVDVVTSALGMDSRVGAGYLTGGLGYGGPCLERDNVALTALASGIGISAHMVEATNKSNQLEVLRVVNLIESKMPPGGSVGVLGLSYKPATDVVEASQGLMLAQQLRAKGVPVSAYDPAAMGEARRILGETVALMESAEECIRRSDVIVIATPWKEFEKLQPAAFGLHGSRVLIDCWRTLEGSPVRKATDYIAMGVGINARDRNNIGLGR